MKTSVLISILCTVSLVACAGRGVKKQNADTRAEEPAVVNYGYKIVNTYPHDAGAYTQGLFWHEGMLWESTGEYGRSTLRQVVLETGEVVRSVALSDDYFAEGAVLLAGKVYQITWQEHKAFVYDAARMEREREFTYKGEGWGLTTDGKNLYMSDGTANITVRDPASFRALRTFPVRYNGQAVQYLNELEWIEGRIWANIYTSNSVVIINPEDGRVEGIIDFTRLDEQIERTPATDVLNGIAYDADTKRIFVTGKNWNRLFEIEIFRK